MNKNCFLIPTLILFALNLSFGQISEWVAELKVNQDQLGGNSNTGLYRVNYDDLSKSLGSSLSSGIPIDRLAIFATVPDSLPEVLDSIRSPLTDLKEQSIRVVDENQNGVFDSKDYFDFFGTPPMSWRRVPSSNQKAVAPQFYHTYSPFSNVRNYHLVIKKSSGKRFQSDPPKSGIAPVLSKVRLYQRIEKDSMLVDYYFDDSNGIIERESGKEWSWKVSKHGQTINFTDLDFGLAKISMPNNADSLWMQVEFQGRRDKSGKPSGILSQSYDLRMTHISLILNYEGQDYGQTILCQPGGCLWELGNAKLFGANFNLQLSDGAEKKHERQLEGLTFSYLFNVSEVEDNWILLPNLGSFQFNSSEQTLVRLENDVPTHLIGSSTTIVDSNSVDREIKYFSISQNKQLSPIITPSTMVLTGVVNDLSTGKPQGASTINPEYIIITPEVFQNQALELAEWRIQNKLNPIKTSVITLENIMRHMGGNFDPAALRNYLAYAKSTWAKNMKYVLLFGNGHFDYRQIEYNNRLNLIPPFESFDLVSDDYYTFLTPGTNLFWKGYFESSLDPDISIGRIPIERASQAELYLSKIKRYESPNEADYGPWRNRVLFLADDFQQLIGVDNINHVGSVDNTLKAIHQNRPDVETQRVYLLDYDLDLSFKKPAAKRDVIRALNDGASLTTYFGHGGAEVIADENIMDIAAVSQLSNADRLTIFTAFSCTVGKWDAASLTPLSEAFLLNGPVGAIATISAVRESFSSSNEALAVAFYKNLYGSNKPITLGEAFRAAKSDIKINPNQRINSQRYNILGEPVLLWNPSKFEIKFDSLPDTLKALDKIELSGSVAGMGDGELYINLREQDIRRTWKDTIDGVPKSATAEVSGRVVYSELLPVKGGRFSTEFISPRKLSFGDTNAVVLAYAYRESHPDYGSFYRESIDINGTSNYADSIQDSSPPDITFYTCAEFGEPRPLGDQVDLSLPLCIQVEVKDSTGLDYIENPDEGISYEIPGLKSPEHPLFIEQSGRRATFRVFLNEDTEEGDYALKVSARDILEQIGQREILLHVSGVLEAGIQSVYSQPNPMKTSAVFHFQSGSTGLNQAEVRIFSQSGKLVKVLKNVISGVTQWDGRDHWGNLLANGLYYYRVLATYSHTDEWTGKNEEKTFSKLQKLVIAR